MKLLNRHLSNQTGGMFPFFAVLIVGIIGITALTIDQGRGLLVHRNAEDLADAVALAASASLDGTKFGWQNAKRLALITVNESRIHGIDPDEASSANAFGAGVDPWEDNDNFGSNVLSIDGGKLLVTIDRGFYAYTGSNENPEFTSLEGSNPQHYHLPKFFVANAVRATVEVRDVATPFGNVVAQLAAGENMESFTSIHGQSIAVRHNQLEFPVAPIAIPACEFLADMNVTSPDRYHRDGLLPSGGIPMPTIHGLAMSDQCQREIIAREPAAEDGSYNSTNKKRLDGYLRAESFPRPPLANFRTGESGLCYANDVEGLHINCKAQPLHASLGAAGGGGTTSRGIDAGALAAALNASAGINPTHVAKLGATFNPMAGRSYLDNDAVRDAALNLINDGDLFKKVFYRGDSPTFNFPYRRNLVSTAEDGYSDPFSEMRITWMTREGGDTREVAMLMGNSGDFHADTELLRINPGEHLRYTNPLCHNNNIPFDDKDNARAKTVNIMLVASPDEPYCDFNSQYGDTGSIDAVAPQSTTSPVIVGYVQAHIFDFRFSQYDEQDWWLGGPDDPDPDDIGIDLPLADEEGNVLTDDNQFAFDSQFELPGLQQYLQDSENFVESKRDYLRCNSCLNSDFPSPECDEEKQDYEDAGRTCPDEPEELSPPPIPTWMEDCFGGSTAIIDILAQLDDLQPHTPPVTNGGGGSIPDGVYPPCKEYCGGIRKYRFSQSRGYELLYFDDDGPDTYDRDCYDEMVANVDQVICDENDTYKEYREQSPDGTACSFGCTPGCCLDASNPPIPSDECSILCEPAPVSFRARCTQLCQTFRDTSDDEQDLINYLASLEQLYEKFKEMLGDRYGRSDDSDPAGGTDSGGRPSETAGPPGMGTNGRQAPNLDLTDYMDTTDGAAQVCLPRRLNDCYDLTNPACWEDPAPRKSGWGCGGIRMRLSCDANSTLAARPFQNLRPALVSK